MNLFSLLKYAPWALAGLLLIGMLWYRGGYESEKAARAADLVKAQAAARSAEDKAQSLSNELVIAQAEAMAIAEKTVTFYQDRILHVPVTTACAQSLAMRDASAGVRQLIRSSSSAAPAGR